MSSGSQKTTTKSNAEPWAAAQPALKTGLADAQDIYSSGQGFQPYTGSTVTPFSDQTMAGMTGIQNTAGAAMADQDSPFSKPLGVYDDLLSGNGLSGMQQGVAGQLEGVARGDELFGANPAFQKVLGQAQEDAAHYANMGASGAGRYGSGKHTDVMASSIGDLTDRMLSGEYGRQLGRQDNARASLAGMGQQGLGNQFAAAGSLPGAFDAQFAPERAMMGVGSMFEDLGTRTIADNQRIFNETQQSPLRAIEWLNAIGSGAGSMGGTSQSTAKAPGPNPFVQAAGFGLGANSLLGNPIGGFF